MPYKLGGVIWNDDGSLYSEQKTIRQYFLVFAKQGENLGTFAFATGDEDVARQFCEDFPSYYYMSREMLVGNTQEEEDSEEDSLTKRETDEWLGFIND